MKRSLVSFAYRKFVAGKLDDMHVLFELTKDLQAWKVTHLQNLFCACQSSITSNARECFTPTQRTRVECLGIG